MDYRHHTIREIEQTNLQRRVHLFDLVLAQDDCRNTHQTLDRFDEPLLLVIVRVLSLHTPNLAEEVGFEPTWRFHPLAFQARPFGRSGTLLLNYLYVVCLTVNEVDR